MGQCSKNNGRFGINDDHFSNSNGHLVELKGHFGKNISETILNRLFNLADSHILI